MKKNKAVRFPTTQLPSSPKIIPQHSGYYDLHPAFSLKYYDKTHKKYSAKCIDKLTDFHVMFEKFQTFSELVWKNIEQSNQFNFHPIEWSKTTEPSGFKNLPNDAKNYPACQFKLFEECRIIGFFNSNNIFEIVWIDRHHEVYKRK